MSKLFLEKKVVSYYKEIKGIKYDIDLLRRIGKELGYGGDVLEEFVLSAKGNFSKILKGKRKINTEYIIPLEKIFSMPIAKLVEPDAYKFLIEKDNICFVKGIKYYAYMDDVNLYKNELSKLIDNDGNPIICNCDEFGKNFLDYVVEYNSINGLKYLRDEFQLKIECTHNLFTSNYLLRRCIFQNSMYITQFIANIKDDGLFFDIYNTYNMFITNGHYGGPSGFFEQEEFLKVILDNEHLFNSIFLEKEYKYYLSNIEKRKNNISSCTLKTINPIIVSCLRCTLNNLDKYKEQAKTILKFAIKNNENVIRRLELNISKYFWNDLGGIYLKNSYEILGIIVFAESVTKDSEVNELVKKLPKKKKYFDKDCLIY